MTSLSQHINCLDQSVSIDKLGQYDIAIRLVSGGFSFVVYDNHQRKFVALSDYHCTTPIDELFSQFDQRHWSLTSFKSARVFIANEYKTLVPQALYNQEANSAYLEFVHDLPQGMVIKADALRNTSTQLVYAFEGATAERFESTPIFNSTSVLIESLSVECKNMTDKPRVFVSIEPDNFDMLTFENGKLVFFNNFKYKTKEDFLYFVLFAFEQQHLNPESIPVYLIGTINENSDIIQLSEKYINDLRFMSRNKNLRYGYKLEEIPFHYHYILYNTLQCEL